MPNGNLPGQPVNQAGAVQGESEEDLQTFFRDVLVDNMGKFVVITATFNGSQQEVLGNIVEVGTDFVRLDRPNTETRTLLPTIFINMVQMSLVPV